MYIQMILLKPPHLIISELLPTIDAVKEMLQDIRYPYLSSRGNQVLFFSKIRNINPLYPLLVNILVGISYPISSVITFNYWDTLVANIIISWCGFTLRQIQISRLFQLIDIINGDTPSKLS